MHVFKGMRNRKGKLEAQKLVYAGAAPAFGYGADCTGISPHHPKLFSQRSSTLLKVGGRGARTGLSWALANEVRAPNPSYQYQFAPLIRYAKEWWLATTKISETDTAR